MRSKHKCGLCVYADECFDRDKPPRESDDCIRGECFIPANLDVVRLRTQALSANGQRFFTTEWIINPYCQDDAKMEDPKRRETIDEFLNRLEATRRFFDLPENYSGCGAAAQRGGRLW